MQRARGIVSRHHYDNFLAVLECPSQFTIDGTGYLLVELDDYSVPASVSGNLQRLISAGLAPINVGFGLDSGYVVGGNIGSERRLEYTLIGVPVNNAAYLSKIRPPDVFVSQNTFLELKAEAKTTPRDPMILKGAVDPIPIYSLDVD